MRGSEWSKGVGRGLEAVRATVLVVGLALPSVAVAQTAAAPPPAQNAPSLERAKTLHAAGVAAFRDGDYAAAIEAFIAADRCVPSAALSFNIARAYERQGDIGQSLYWYSDYLRRAPDAPDAAQARALIAEREATLAGQGQQLLVVRTNPSGARVLLDGVSACTSPCAVVTRPGVHALSLSHDTYAPLAVRVGVGQARMTEVHLELVATSDTETSAQPPPVTAAPVAEPRVDPVQREPLRVAAPPPAAPPSAAPVESPTSRQALSLAPWPWVTLIAGGVGLGAAGGLELVRRDAEADAEAARVQLGKQDALDRMDQAMWGARIVGAVGGALLLTSGVLWWWDTRDSDGASRTAARPVLTPVLAPGQAGLQVSVTRDVW